MMETEKKKNRQTTRQTARLMPRKNQEQVMKKNRKERMIERQREARLDTRREEDRQFTKFVWFDNGVKSYKKNYPQPIVFFSF